MGQAKLRGTYEERVAASNIKINERNGLGTFKRDRQFVHATKKKQEREFTPRRQVPM